MKMLAINLCVYFVVALSHIVASDNINPHLCTHFIYAFVGLDSKGSVVSLDSYLDLPDNNGRNNFGKFNALKNQNPSLKTLVAVGGWNEGSAKFSRMAASSSLRQNLNSALKMITTHGFDGLDIDWEYPNRRDTVHGVADVDNFTNLLKELRAVFDKKRLLLTAAVSAVKAAASQSYDVAGISKYLDMVNIMAYDMNGAWDPVTDHNAPLFQGEGDKGAVGKDVNTVEQSLKFWIGAGCPPEKIALGVPFYGRTFTLTSATQNGVRAPSSGKGIPGPYTATSGFIGYNEFCSKLKTETWTKRIDSLAKVPYAIKDKNWVSYDDTKSITAKIEYAKQFNITKIMIWSIETDDFHGLCGNGPYPLLSVINNVLGFNLAVTTVTPSNVTNTPSTTNTPTTVTNNVCKEEGYIPKPGDCSRFLYCMKDATGRFIPKQFKCPANLLWDQNLLGCNYPSLVACN